MYRSYSLATLEKLIASADENGYRIVQVSDSALGLGHMFLIAPVPGYWNFEIRERPLNEWGSVHELRRFTKVSKHVQELIDA